VNPSQLAEFYHEVYGLEASKGADGKFSLSDGMVTLVVAQWDIRDYADTGIERPAIEHLGFVVESMNQFRRDLDDLMESRPEWFPTSAKDSTEGARRMEMLATCARGELQLCDPDGVLLDVAEAR
jgi:hypothetical protein